LELGPYRVFASFRPASLSVGVRLPEVSGPFNDVRLQQAPYEVGCPTPPRLRSQAFSTSQRFPSKQELCGLVSCHNRSWDPPFRAFPSQGSRSSLEVAGSLAVIHRPAEVNRASPCHRWFHRRPRFHAVAWIPQRLWTSFPRAEARFPFVLGSARPSHLVRPASPTSELSSPRETVPATLGCPSEAGRFSPGFLPLRSFLLPRLGFSTRPSREGLNMFLRPKTQDHDTEDRWPPVPGETFLSTSTQEDLVDSSQPLEG
jgi:hypothetical protein